MQTSGIIANKSYTEHPDTELFQMHTHDGYEIFCFLRGKAKYFVEGTVYPLRAGDILIMKKSESHALLLLKDTPYERITVHFRPSDLVGGRSESIMAFLNERILGKNNRFSASAFKERKWHYYLGCICSTQDNDLRALYLTVLLSELSDSAHEIVEDTETKDSISDIIHYINSNLDGDLSLDSICSEFHMSRSHTNRKFRRITGSSMGEYIKLKRLMMARELLTGGENPYRVYEKCGFNEYSSFYRAYRSKFGVSPKADHKKD